MKILIAYDGSKSANAALADLQRAGLPADALALVLSVADVWLPPHDGTIAHCGSVRVGVRRLASRP